MGSVAVVIATFNGERFLADQLESIARQTITPDVIWVSDDGSTDSTKDVARAFQGEHPHLNVRVVSHPPPSGVARNFQWACEQATQASAESPGAEWIVLADQDDSWYPGKIEALLTLVHRHPKALMVHSDALLVDSEGDSLGMTVLESLRITRAEKRNLLRGRGLRALVRRNLVTGQTAMIHRDLLAISGDIPEGWLHDEWWALVAASVERLVTTPQVLQNYRQHEANQVGATRSGLERLLERWSEPQEHFRKRHRVRHEGLQAFLERSGSSLPATSRRLLEGRLQHYRFQASLPARRVARVGPVVGRAMRGDYCRFRRGGFDLVRDLLQPGETG